MSVARDPAVTSTGNDDRNLNCSKKSLLENVQPAVNPYFKGTRNKYMSPKYLTGVSFLSSSWHQG